MLKKVFLEQKTLNSWSKIFISKISITLSRFHYNSNLIQNARSFIVDRRVWLAQTRRFASRLIWWSVPNNLTWSGISDQVTVIIIIFISKEKDLIKIHYRTFILFEASKWQNKDKYHNNWALDKCHFLHRSVFLEILKGKWTYLTITYKAQKQNTIFRPFLFDRAKDNKKTRQCSLNTNKPFKIDLNITSKTDTLWFMV